MQVIGKQANVQINGNTCTNYMIIDEWDKHTCTGFIQNSPFNNTHRVTPLHLFDKVPFDEINDLMKEQMCSQIYINYTNVSDSPHCTLLLRNIEKLERIEIVTDSKMSIECIECLKLQEVLKRSSKQNVKIDGNSGDMKILVETSPTKICTRLP